MKTPQEIAEEIVMKLPDEHRMTSYGMDIAIAVASAIQSERDRLTAYREKMLGVLEERGENDCDCVIGDGGLFIEGCGCERKTHNTARSRIIEADAEYFREKEV